MESPVSTAVLSELSRKFSLPVMKQIALELIKMDENDLKNLEYGHRTAFDIILDIWIMWGQRKLHPGPTPSRLLAILQIC